MLSKSIVFMFCLAGIAAVCWFDDDEQAVPALPKDTLPDAIAWDQVPVGFEELPAAPWDRDSVHIPS